MENSFEIAPSSELFKPGTGITEHTFILVAEHEHERKKEPFGSGFFVAPNLGLTARHVFDQMWREYNYNTKLPFKERESETNIKVYAYQYLEGENEPAVWYAEMVWNSEFTDISFLSLKPANELAKNYQMTARPELTMDMPQIDQKITAYGFPKIINKEPQGAIEVGSLKLFPIEFKGQVTEVHEQRRDRGMIKWPCFEVNARFDHGMSGGPVYNEQGQTCGIVCHDNTASALWPAFFTPVDFENETISFPEQYFLHKLFENKFIRQKGWDKYFGQYLVDFEIIKDAWNDEWKINWYRPEQEDETNS